MANKEQIYQYKGNMCSICGMGVVEMLDRYGTFNRMFELHHVDPEKKDPNYKNLIKQNISTAQIDEVDKCILLCGNCHSLIHAQNIKAKLTLQLNHNGKEIRQEFNGWMIYDFKNHKANFLAEEKILLRPYYSKTNNQKEELVYGVDLASGEYFKDSLKLLSKNDIFAIFNAINSKCMLQATHLGEKIKIEHDISFGFLEVEASKGTKGSKMWYRNGMVLMENGEIIDSGIITYYLASDSLP